MTTIVLADDHFLLRKGLKDLFESLEGFLVVGEAENGKEALDLVVKHRPDIAILDISMPQMNGIETARLIGEKTPGTRTLILTVYDDADYIAQVIQVGVDGYILKNSSPEDIINAVRTVAAGKRYLGQGVSKTIVENFITQARAVSKNSKEHKPRLTKRETEILRRIAQGYTSKEISNKLFLSVRTVQSHRMNIMQKLDIHETAGLVMYAVRNGLIESPQISNR